MQQVSTNTPQDQWTILPTKNKSTALVISFVTIRQPLPTQRRVNFYVNP